MDISRWEISIKFPENDLEHDRGLNKLRVLKHRSGGLRIPLGYFDDPILPNYSPPLRLLKVLFRVAHSTVWLNGRRFNACILCGRTTDWDHLEWAGGRTSLLTTFFWTTVVHLMSMTKEAEESIRREVVEKLQAKEDLFAGLAKRVNSRGSSGEKCTSDILSAIHGTTQHRPFPGLQRAQTYRSCDSGGKSRRSLYSQRF